MLKFEKIKFRSASMKIACFLRRQRKVLGVFVEENGHQLASFFECTFLSMNIDPKCFVILLLNVLLSFFCPTVVFKCFLGPKAPHRLYLMEIGQPNSAAMQATAPVGSPECIFPSKKHFWPPTRPPQT